MRVLVTGHLGYIGVELAPLLVSLGHDVVGLDADYYTGCDFLAPPDPLPALPVDLRDVTPANLAGFDAVVHLAALSNDPLAETSIPSSTYDINLTASIRLAQAAKAAGVRRFVFSSSCSLYGKGSENELAENAPFNPVTPYGESKIGVEHELATLADRHFSPVFLRNATAYGLSRRLRADVVVNNLVCSAVTTGKVLLHTTARHGDPSCTSSTSRRGSRGCWRRPKRRSTIKHSMWAASARTIACWTSRPRSPRSCRIPL